MGFGFKNIIEKFTGDKDEKNNREELTVEEAKLIKEGRDAIQDAEDAEQIAKEYAKSDLVGPEAPECEEENTDKNKGEE